MSDGRHVVGLVQVNNGFSGQHYLPYSVGVLEAYAKANLENKEEYEFLLPVFCRQPVEQAVTHLLGADIAAFSLYVWNEQISLHIARELKKRKPETLIVFGGPQVPDRVESFLKDNRFVDIAVHGEGEEVFTAILKELPGRDFSGVPGVSYVEEGRVVTHPRPPRIKDLDIVPSPYLTGVFCPLMAQNPAHKWIAMWETNRGCPYRCTFCDWGSATAQKVYGAGLDRLHREVEWFASNRIEYVFTADANFGIFERDEDLANYCAEVKARTGYPARLSVQSTKSGRLGSKLTERAFQVQKILSDSGLNQGVVVSMQSIDEETLKAIERDNISTEAFREIQNRFTAAGVETMTDLILGLPGETYNSFANGVSDLIAGGQHNRIQFNNLGILPNAKMGDPAYQKKYGMKMVQSRIINIHGYKEEFAGDVDEYQELVIATNSTSREDWVRTRVFAWMSAFLHFDKILQIPLMLAHEVVGASYREIIERFMDKEALRDYPVLSKIHSLFEAKALDIQSGGEEYCYSKEWLGIWWPADEYALIEVVSGGHLSEFYAEAEKVLLGFAKGSAVFPAILKDALRLNQALLKVPFVDGNLEVKTFWNVLEFRKCILRGEKCDIPQGEFIFDIDRSSERWNSLADWCREVVWYGNKRGAYLYGHAATAELAGHY